MPFYDERSSMGGGGRPGSAASAGTGAGSPRRGTSRPSVHGMRKKLGKWTREELEDQFFRVYEENLALKKDANELKLQAKRATTKLRQRNTGSGAQAGSQGPRRISELEDKLADSQERVRALERANEALKSKMLVMKHATQKKKPKRSTAYDHVQPRVTQSARGARPESASRRQETEAMLRMQRDDLEQARSENELLRQDLQTMDGQFQAAENAYQSEIETLRVELDTRNEELDRLEAQLRSSQVAVKQRGIDDDMQVIRIKRDLHDKASQVKALTAKLEVLQHELGDVQDENEGLQTRMRSAAQSHERVKAWPEREARPQPGSLSTSSGFRGTSSGTRHLEAQIQELQDEIRELRTTNDRVVTAALNDEREQSHVAKQQLLNERIAQLEAECNENLAEQQEMLTKLTNEKDEHAETQEAKRELHRRLLALKGENERLLDKMRFFTKESSIDFKEIEEALLVVRERKARRDQPGLDFLLPTEAQNSLNTERELRMVRAAHAETVLELEKARKVLELEHRISAEYKAKAEDFEARFKGVQAERDTEVANYARMVDSRTNRVKQLESQLRDIAYGTHQYRVGALGSQDQHTAADSTAAAAGHAADIGAPVDLERGQNVLELHISHVDIFNGVIPAADPRSIQSFVTYDFFEHETQSTPVMTGLHPDFGSTSQYVVTVDEFFLKYLRKGSMTLELHRAENTNFTTLAACQVRFSQMFADEAAGQGQKVHGKAELIGLHNPGVKFGVVHYWMRLRVPMEQAFRLHREKLKAQHYANAPDEGFAAMGRLQASVVGAQPNTLVVELKGCHGVKAKNHPVQPAAFVSYQFFEHKPYTSSTVPSSSDPVFNTVQRFPVAMNEPLDEHLRTALLDFIAVDENDPDQADYLGIAEVPLAGLAYGERVGGQFPLVAPDGRDNGTVEVEMHWTDPYSIQGPINAGPPPHSAPTHHQQPASVPGPAAAKQATDTVTAATVDNQYPPDFVPAVSSASSESSEGDEQEFLEDNEATEDEAAGSAAGGSFEGYQEPHTLEASAAHAGPVIEEEAGGELESPALPRLDKVETAEEHEQTDEDVLMSPEAPLSRSKQRSKSTKPLFPENAYIEVVSVSFDPGAQVLDDDSVQRLFVSYQFLGVPPERLESPSSMRKPDQAALPMNFGFGRYFVFDGRDEDPPELRDPLIIGGPKRPKYLKALAREIKKNGSFPLCFELVNEPSADDEEATCETVGLSEVDLAKAFKAGHDLKDEEVPLIDPNTRDRIGTMAITLVCNDALKFWLKRKKR